MEYIENIKTLCGKADDPGLGYAQITIDFFQEFEDQFFDGTRNLNEFPIERDELGAKQYQISTLLDVMDQVKFQKDIELFNKMDAEIGAWEKAVEARNILLGIPRHKG
jgi:hypothetical protein